MDEVKNAFRHGLDGAWRTFWSPFKGLFRSIKELSPARARCDRTSRKDLS